LEFPPTAPLTRINKENQFSEDKTFALSEKEMTSSIKLDFKTSQDQLVVGAPMDDVEGEKSMKKHISCSDLLATISSKV